MLLPYGCRIRHDLATERQQQMPPTQFSNFCKKEQYCFYRTIFLRNINNFRYADDTILIAESKEELRSLLMKVKDESEKVGLKVNIQKMKIVACGPIASWQIDGKKMETVTDLIFLGSRITVDGDCSHEIERCLLLGREAMTNLEKTLMLGKIEGRRRRGQQRTRWLHGITESMNMTLSKFWEMK